MSDTPVVPVDQAARTYATDPRHHVVLEASAGTGKTRVLVDRYLALLAAGVDPRHVLAITFTRKAAAEMRERIVTDLQSRHPGVWQGLRDRADDIAVSTIDAFCFALLREFPLEAGLDPGFTLADETEVARLVEMSLDRTLRECRDRAPVDEGIRLVLAQLTLPRLSEGLRALLERRFVAPTALRQYLRTQVRQVRSEAASAERARQDLRTRLEALPGGLERWIASGPAGVPLWTLSRLDIDQLLADPARVPMTAAEVRAAFDGLARWLLTREGEARKKPPAVKADFASATDWNVHREGLAEAAACLVEARRGFEASLNVLLARGIRRVFRLAYRRYLETLLLHDALDFSEVLQRAVQLLANMDEFSRSRFRLEARYQHVLVDEFQDTSRLQWQLVASLVEAWGAGFGLGHEGPLPPSLFLVGDRKQSIYRFRDADVGLLDEAVSFVRSLADDAPVRQAISQSFRSHADLLALANDLAAGMVQPGAPPAVAFRYGPDDRFPLPAGHAPDLDADPRLALVLGDDVDACAAGVAAEIARLLDEGLVTDRGDAAPRRVRPGDIAILFRSRESHREFERALSARDIPSYVYKGLGFYDADEIKDLVALVRVLAAPESHLRVAAFLRSGFVSLSDEGLRRLAPDLAGCLAAGHRATGTGTREDRSLNDQGRQIAADQGLSVDDAEALARVRAAWPGWLALVDRLPPAEVIDHVLEHSAYAATLRGHRQAQARENVKKFRGLVRRIQNRGYATMARIAGHIDRVSAGDESNAAVDAADAVNLMTVHASKGLEFPIVFLVNLTRGTGGVPPPLRVLAGDSGDEPIVGVARYEPGATAAEQMRDREESKRLMYVAVTRARERLYLSAAASRQGKVTPGPGSLAAVCPEGLLAAMTAALASDQADVTWQGSTHLHRWRVCRPTQAPPPLASRPLVAECVTVPADVPDSLQPLSAQPPVMHVRVTALAAGRLAAPTGPGHGPEMDADLVFGRAVHRLLARGQVGESRPSLVHRVLVDMEPDERLVVDDPATLAEDVARVVEDVWSDPGLCDALASASARFEVPIVFRHTEAGQVHLVRGTVDCLVTTAEGVRVLEFKTGRPQPVHRRQLALYVEAMREMLPGTPVEGRLVYAARPAPAAAPQPARLPFDSA